MNELTGSAKIADDAINWIDGFYEPDTRMIVSLFRLAYAALRILANIADALAKMDR